MFNKTRYLPPISTVTGTALSLHGHHPATVTSAYRARAPRTPRKRAPPSGWTRGAAALDDLAAAGEELAGVPEAAAAPLLLVGDDCRVAHMLELTA